MFEKDDIIFECFNTLQLNKVRLYEELLYCKSMIFSDFPSKEISFIQIEMSLKNIPPSAKLKFQLTSVSILLNRTICVPNQ